MKTENAIGFESLSQPCPTSPTIWLRSDDCSKDYRRGEHAQLAHAPKGDDAANTVGGSPLIAASCQDQKENEASAGGTNGEGREMAREQEEEKEFFREGWRLSWYFIAIITLRWRNPKTRVALRKIQRPVASPSVSKGRGRGQGRRRRRRREV